MARWRSSATTALSTPPDSAQITRSLPTRSRMRAVASSMNAPMRKLKVTPHSSRNASYSSRPRGVWATSAWNWMAYKRFSGLATAQNGELSLRPMTRNPRGGADTLSPWLIHTSRCSPGRISPKGPTGSITSTRACPYSRWAVRSMAPPSSLAISWRP